MKLLLREALCLAVALLVSWWCFLRRPPTEVVGVARLAPGAALPMELTPLLGAEHESAVLLAPEADEPGAPVEEAPAPPPAESGTPEGEPREELLSRAQDPAPHEPTPEPIQSESPAELESRPGSPPEDVEPAESPLQSLPSEEPAAAQEREPEPTAEPTAEPTPESERVPDAPSVLDLPAPEPTRAALEEAPSSPADERVDGSASAERAAQAAADEPRPVSALMRDPALLATAGAELSGEERSGFATVLLGTPEDQLAIASYFGEELVLVPRQALDPAAQDPRWFRITDGSGRVEEVRGRPPLERYRQYRDLFDYEYARLPAPLRDLRRRLASRRDVYVFAALLPAREWAVVVARRAEALARAGRELSEVRRFVLRYIRLAEGAFDLAVDHVVFGDGSRYHPLVPEEKGDRTQ